MATENDSDKDVCNGDIGFVRATERELGDVTIEYDGRAVRCGAHELDQVVLDYPTTVHKAKGREYSAVGIPVTTQLMFTWARRQDRTTRQRVLSSTAP